MAPTKDARALLNAASGVILPAGFAAGTAILSLGLSTPLLLARRRRLESHGTDHAAAVRERGSLDDTGWAALMFLSA